jgi:hypothetical protein
VRVAFTKMNQNIKKKSTEYRNNIVLVLDHVPSSCIVVMVHVVKGRQYSAYTVLHAGASIAEMESETDSRPQ